jgi:hypothetical protein
MPTSPNGFASNTSNPTATRADLPVVPPSNPLINGLSISPGGARSSAIAAPSSPRRIKAWIQNLSNANPLFVKLGPGCTVTDYHRVLKVGTGAADGSGGDWTIDGYSGEISVASAGSISYCYVSIMRGNQ